MNIKTSHNQPKFLAEFVNILCGKIKSTNVDKLILVLLHLVGIFFIFHACFAKSEDAILDIPVVFNAPLSAHPGDIVGLQGENFGGAPTITLEGLGGQTEAVLPPYDTYGTGWLAVKIPETATGALVVHVNNGKASSAPVKLNAARAYHLDAMQIVSKGAYRIFGRNLFLSGFTPTVLVNGLRASVDTSVSDEHMLAVSAPQGLSTKTKAVITVDNGNGTGPSELDRQIDVIAGGNVDPFVLGVGWANAFSSIAFKTFQAIGDSRLSRKVVCNGVADDTNAIQAGIDSVAKSGGGVLQIPAGTCHLMGSLKLKSRVVLQGFGKNRTIIKYEGNYPLWGRDIDLSGVRALTLMNVGGQIENSLLQDSTRVFFQDVTFLLGGGKHMFLTNNKDFVVKNSDFIQPSNPVGYGPYTFSGCSGLIFVGNSTNFANGGTVFSGVHDAYISNNHFSRDITGNQNSKSVVHSLTLDFAYRVAVIGNTFDVLGGPITNKMRNDGETLLTEGGGGRRTENIGTVTAATSNTLSDSSNKINVMPFSIEGIPENYGVAIVGGKGAGQSRRITGYSLDTLTVDKPWTVVPNTNSHYATFVWGLEKSLIKGNTLIQNSRGIWLYQTAVREVDIVDNIINEGGGIYLRSSQILKDKLFVPIYGVRIANNTITNTSREWPSYINVTFVRRDAKDFGIGTIGVEIRKNVIKANIPNLSLSNEESGGAEGYLNLMHVEVEYQNQSNQIRLLGTIFQNNTCVDCAIAYKVREGARGTVQEENLTINSQH